MQHAASARALWRGAGVCLHRAAMQLLLMLLVHVASTGEAAPPACTDEFVRVCGHTTACGVCVGQHQHSLRSASCTAADVRTLCTGSTTAYPLVIDGRGKATRWYQRNSYSHPSPASVNKPIFIATLVANAIFLILLYAHRSRSC